MSNSTSLSVDDLRQIVEQLDEWRRAPGDLPVAGQVIAAAHEAAVGLCGQTLTGAFESMIEEQSRILADLPAETAERLRLCSEGIHAVRQIAEAGQEWVTFPDKYKGWDW